jgi:hypothetical protein
MGTLHEGVFTYMIISRWILLGMRNILVQLVEKTQAHVFMFSNLFQKSCRLWEKVEKYGGAREDTDDNIINSCASHAG